MLLDTYNKAVVEAGMPRGEVMVYRHTWLGRTEKEALEFYDDVLSEYNHYLASAGGFAKIATRDERLTTRSLAKEAESIKAGKLTARTESPSSEGLFEKYADPILTTPDKMIERFKSLEAMGVDHVTCLMAMGMPGTEVVKNMELMAKEVLPAFAD